MTPLMGNVQNRLIPGCQGLGEGMEGHCSWGRVSFWGDQSVLKSTVVMATQLCEYSKATELHTLNR